MNDPTPFNPPAAPDFTPPAIKEAFGWEQTFDVPPSLKIGVQSAGDTLNSLLGNINQRVTEQWADVAVAADMLKAKISYAIDGTISSVQNTLVDLQQPVATSVLSTLSQAAEMAAGLGVVLPMPNAPPADPMCTLIREAGNQGSIDAALEAYRSMAFDQRFTRGQGYADAVEFITNCLPDDPNIRERFAAAVLQLQSLPDGANPSAVIQQSALPTGSVAAAPDAAVVTAGTVPPGSTLTGGVYLPGFGPTPGSTRSVQPTTQAFIPAPLPGGGGVGGAVGQLPGFPGGGPIAGQPGAGGALPGAGAGGAAQGGAAPFPGCGVVSGMTPGMIAGVWGAPGSYHPVNTMSGQEWGWAYSIVSINPDGTCIIEITTSGPGTSQGFGFPPAQCNTSVSQGTPSPVAPPVTIPPPIGQPPTPPQQPPTKPPSPAPPPQKPPESCIRICPDETKPKTCTYDVYCGYESKILYVVQSNGTPRNPRDSKLASGDCASLDWQSLLNQCSGSQTTPPAQGSVGGPAIGPFGVGCPDFPPAPAAAPGVNPGTAFLQWLGLQDNNGNPTIPFPGAGVSQPGNLLVNAVVGFINTQLNQIVTAAGAMYAGGPCAGGQQLGLIATAELIGFIERWLGWDLSQIRIPNQQQRNFNCPVELPSANAAASAWLSNEIDDATLRCWLQAANQLPNEAMTWVRSQRTKISPAQAATLYQRGFLSAEDFQLRLRAAGMIQPTDGDDLMRLLRALPGPGQIIDFMASDSTEDGVVSKFQLDDSFAEKNSGQLLDWLNQNGVSEQQAKLAWRSHWRPPGISQLLEMNIRLGRRDPNSAEFLDANSLDAALAQNGVSPFWRPLLLAMSQKPLSIRQVAQAYTLGEMTYDDMLSAFMDLGYNPDNARRLADVQVRRADLSFLRHWSVKAYAQGTITRADFEEVLRTDGASDTAVQLAADRAELLLSASTRRNCTKSINRRFIIGEIDVTEAQQQLVGFGLGADQAQSLTEGWQCLREARGKIIGASDLCGLFEIGAIGIADVVAGLQRLDYSYDDAVLLARKCAWRVNEKLTKQEIATMKALQAQAKQAAAAQAKDAAAAARQARQQAQSAARMLQIKVAREKRLIEAGEKFSKHFPGTLADSILAVKSAFNAAVASTLYTYDEIINALVVVTQSSEVFDIPSLTQALNAALADVVVPETPLDQAITASTATTQSLPTAPPQTR